MFFNFVDELREAGIPASFKEHCLDVAEQMLILGERTTDGGKAREQAEQALKDGSAWQKFLDLVEAQGGDITFIEDQEKFPKAAIVQVVRSPKTGYISQIHARIVGEASVDLGAGRAKKDDQIDHAVGIEILREVGDHIKKGEDLFILHAADQNSFEQARDRLLEAHEWSDSPVERLPLVYDIIS